MQTRTWYPACDGRADIQKIRIPFGPGPDHRIVISDHIGFARGNLLAERWRVLRLIGCTRPGRNTAHGLIGAHLASRVGRDFRRYLPLFPSVLINPAHIQSGRDSHFGAQFGQTFGVFHRCDAHVDRRIYVGRFDIHESIHTEHRQHAMQDAHGHLGGGAFLPGEECPIKFRQDDVHRLSSSRNDPSIQWRFGFPLQM